MLKVYFMRNRRHDTIESLLLGECLQNGHRVQSDDRHLVRACSSSSFNKVDKVGSTNPIDE